MLQLPANAEQCGAGINYFAVAGLGEADRTSKPRISSYQLADLVATYPAQKMRTINKSLGYIKDINPFLGAGLITRGVVSKHTYLK